MATKVIFNGKTIFEPTASSQIKSGIKNPPLALSSGNVCIVDTGRGAGFGGRSGVNGAESQSKDSIYSFDNIDDFRNFVGGGQWYLYSEPLFRPAGAGIGGASVVHYIRAATTTKSSLTTAWTGGGANGGTLNLRTLWEGKSGHGIEDETVSVGSIEVTAAATGADTINFEVDASEFAIYTAGGAEAEAVTALGLADAINAAVALLGTHSYIASIDPNDDTIVLISAPAGLGVGGDSLVITSAVTGTITSTVTTFAGGADGSDLKQGFAYTMESGANDSAKHILKFWKGTYTGLDADLISYNELSKAESRPVLVAKSIEFDNMQEVIDWMAGDFDFGQYFENNSSVVTGTGAIDAADLAATAGNQMFAGGSEIFSASDLQDALDAIVELDYTFMIANDAGASAYSANNVSLLAHIANDAKFEKFIGVAGGNTRNEFESQSVANAILFDDDRVMLVHSGVKVPSKSTANRLRNRDAFWTMCAAVGRKAGIEPQNPLTLKKLKVSALQHEMTAKERERAFDTGVLHCKFDSDIGTFVFNQGIMTIQKNDFLVNDDGTSHELTIKHITSQLNKEIEVNAKLQLLATELGANRNNLSTTVVEEWLAGYLGRRTASPTIDNLIISFQDITVTVEGDIYRINYAFVPNFPVNKLLFTGFIIDPNIS